MYSEFHRQTFRDVGEMQHCWVQRVVHVWPPCWVLLAKLKNGQQHPTCCNMAQQGSQTCATCCTQQCCDNFRYMLQSFCLGLTPSSVVTCITAAPPRKKKSGGGGHRLPLGKKMAFEHFITIPCKPVAAHIDIVHAK